MTEQTSPNQASSGGDNRGNGSGNGSIWPKQGPEGIVFNDEHEFNAFHEFIANTISSRTEWFSRRFDKRRDIDDECGYPKEVVNPEFYWDLYDREAVAARVVEVMPKETWQTQPKIYEDEDASTNTPFEQDLIDIGQQLAVEMGSTYQDDSGSSLLQLMLQADILSGVGYYGVVFLGIDDGLDPRLPVAGIEEQNSVSTGYELIRNEDGEPIKLEPDPNFIANATKAARDRWKIKPGMMSVPGGVCVANGVVVANAKGPDGSYLPYKLLVNGKDVTNQPSPYRPWDPRKVQGAAIDSSYAWDPQRPSGSGSGLAVPAYGEYGDASPYARQRQGGMSTPPAATSAVPGVASTPYDGTPYVGWGGTVTQDMVREGMERDGLAPDGSPLSDVDQAGATPEKVQGPEGPTRRLLYARVFPEHLAMVTRFESNPTSPRFGKPTEYLITFNDPRERRTGIGAPIASRNVHWTRVVHIADTDHSPGTSPIFATPRLKPVLNRVLDLRKLYSGSAEMYWRGAFPGYTVKSQPQLGGDVRVNPAAVKSQMENYFNGLQRYLLAIGLDVEAMSPQVVDPSQQIDKQIEAICIKLEMPKRIFMGSERGELSSGQDDSTFNDRIRRRQRGYTTPGVICPIIDRFILLGLVRHPRGYSVSWPDLENQTEQDKANVAISKIQAIVDYINTQNIGTVLSPLDLYVRILGVDEEEAKTILEAAKQWQLENPPSQQPGQPGQTDQLGQPQQPGDQQPQQFGQTPTEPADTGDGVDTGDSTTGEDDYGSIDEEGDTDFSVPGGLDSGSDALDQLLGNLRATRPVAATTYNLSSSSGEFEGRGLRKEFHRRRR